MTRAERTARIRDARCEDVEWLIGYEAPERIAHRLGYSCLPNLTDQLRRWGRADLAAQLRNRQDVAA